MSRILAVDELIQLSTLRFMRGSTADCSQATDLDLLRERLHARPFVVPILRHGRYNNNRTLRERARQDRVRARSAPHGSP
jgi:hypothetical protein